MGYVIGIYKLVCGHVIGTLKLVLWACKWFFEFYRQNPGVYNLILLLPRCTLVAYSLLLNWFLLSCFSSLPKELKLPSIQAKTKLIFLCRCYTSAFQ